MEPFLVVLFLPFLKCHLVKTASTWAVTDSRNTPTQINSVVYQTDIALLMWVHPILLGYG